MSLDHHGMRSVASRLRGSCVHSFINGLSVNHYLKVSHSRAPLRLLRRGLGYSAAAISAARPQICRCCSSFLSRGSIRAFCFPGDSPCTQILLFPLEMAVILHPEEV